MDKAKTALRVISRMFIGIAILYIFLVLVLANYRMQKLYIQNGTLLKSILSPSGKYRINLVHRNEPNAWFNYGPQDCYCVCVLLETPGWHEKGHAKTGYGLTCYSSDSLSTEKIYWLGDNTLSISRNPDSTIYDFITEVPVLPKNSIWHFPWDYSFENKETVHTNLYTIQKEVQ